jgi:hypothetical protein
MLSWASGVRNLATIHLYGHMFIIIESAVCSSGIRHVRPIDDPQCGIMMTARYFAPMPIIALRDVRFPLSHYSEPRFLFEACVTCWLSVASPAELKISSCICATIFRLTAAAENYNSLNLRLTFLVIRSEIIVRCFASRTWGALHTRHACL